MSVWRPARRMARRSIRRNLARSILIALLIGLPVAVATFSDVLYRSSDSPARAAYLALGDADAKLVVTDQPTIEDFRQGTEWEGYAYDDDAVTRDPASVDVAALLPHGTVLEQDDEDGSGSGLLLQVLGGSDVEELPLQYATLPSRLQPDRLQLREGSYPKAGEVVLTEAAAEGLKAGAGDTVTDDLSGIRLRVSGIVRDEQCRSCQAAYAQSGQDLVPPVPNADGYVWEPGRPTYLVDLPAGVDANALAPSLAERGVLLYSRDTYLHPDRYQTWDEPSLTYDELRGAALTTLIVGLGLLEVILLAGAAFAVGARKQVREMGLINAGGASPRQLRAVLLVQGATLGVIGTTGGVAVGFLVAWLGWPLWEWLNGSVLPVFRFGPEVLIAVVVGILSGVLAAVVPAIGASRQQPLDALSGRFRITGARSRRAGLLGLAGILAGAVLALVGSAQMADDFREYSAALAMAKQTGNYVSAPSPTIPVALVLMGAVLAIAGLVLAMPVLIGRLGRLGARLPLAGRIALRDADRHRHRTGPAASAIMLAVAGSVVAAFAIAGSVRGDQEAWIPSLPPGVMQVYPTYVDPDEVPATVEEAAQRAAAALPDGTALPAGELGYPNPGAQQEQGGPAVEQVWFSGGAACPDSCVSYGVGGSAALADPALARAVLGRDLSAAETAALADGEVLALLPGLVGGDGRVTADLEGLADGDGDGVVEEKDIPRLSLPARVVEAPTAYASMPGVLMSPETAQANGLVVVPTQRFVTFDADATKGQVRAGLRAAAEGHRASASVERPYHSESGLALLVTGGLAALVTLIGVAIAVALSAAEGRRELATLSAVGADPAVRRRLAGAQALVISGVGALVGVVLGSFVSYALRATFGASSFTVPWANLVGVGLGVPILAALITAACTRSRVPMLERRA
ncbi:FtsX-like permease family protein [Nocardioides nitrophenolicus]|uniref:FtsX-like permease family protein n=1 Tax=Nocardioides nitrophenolicus TaxID=60489 RepID=UPI00195B5F6A|nr:FtsX-like permease family protein [Nocardioides nitrophenolicus]MBM7518902.1 putative ABC transport system permease protein [Nocardioides nitrophenolicus]